MSARILTALALVLALTMTAAAQAGRVAADVARALHSYPQLTVFDAVTIEVIDHVVMLSGKVTRPFKKAELAERMRAIDGVVEVRNDIGVLPESAEDDALRARVARAIYGHPAFHRYAAMPHPPIRIVVEHGAVTLSGVVPTEVDRTLARSLAAAQAGREVTCALRTVGESRAP